MDYGNLNVNSEKDGGKKSFSFIVITKAETKGVRAMRGRRRKRKKTTTTATKKKKDSSVGDVICVSVNESERARIFLLLLARRLRGSVGLLIFKRRRGGGGGEVERDFAIMRFSMGKISSVRCG
jgi:hypothetical protein